MAGERDRTPVDRSGTPAQGHLVPPAPSSRRPLRLQAVAPQAIEWAADQLIAGDLVAFPTDTVYALGASLAHGASLRRLFSAKGRPPEKPLPVLLAAASDLDRIALALDPRVLTLVARYWPGPLTVVVPAREGMPEEVVGPDRTVGARVPNHFLAVELIAKAGGALAATSANRSGHPPASNADDVERELGDRLDLLLDGGTAPGGVPSTVVAFRGDELIVLREGAIPREHLAAAWAEVVGGAHAAGERASDAPAPSG